MKCWRRKSMRQETRNLTKVSWWYSIFIQNLRKDLEAVSFKNPAQIKFSRLNTAELLFRQQTATWRNNTNRADDVVGRKEFLKYTTIAACRKTRSTIFTNIKNTKKPVKVAKYYHTFLKRNVSCGYGSEVCCCMQSGNQYNNSINLGRGFLLCPFTFRQDLSSKGCEIELWYWNFEVIRSKAFRLL